MRSILVVDDVKENIEILREILKDEYKINFAKNGKRALKLAETVTPDIILLDIMMPEMDGYEVCDRLKLNPATKNIPVIFVSAKDQDTDEAKGFKVGAVDYITKPLSAAIVKARIKTHIDLSNQNKALARQVSEKTKEIYETRLAIIKKLGRASEYRDNETGMHIERVSRICYSIAKEYGFDEETSMLIMNAAPMHDFGKIGIPDYIIQKPGKLDAAEWELMKKHPEIGADIIGDHPSDILKVAKIIAMQHHEKWNGKGYPAGLNGAEISIYARIAAVADVFDALTSKRPYKEPWDIDRAIDLISNEAGEHFDPKVVECFLRRINDIVEIKEKFKDIE